MKDKVFTYLNQVSKKLFTERNFRISIDIFRNLILSFSIIFALLCFLGLGIGAGYFASLVRNEPLKTKEELAKEIYNFEETTKLYFAGNVPIGNLRSDLYRNKVALEDISPHVIDALIATEDQHFYEHKGIVPKAVLRALFQEAANTSMQSGGSTLTQQLVKNQLLTNDVSFDRKAKELLLAMRVEKLFTKEEILEAYLNVVPFGRNASGQNIAGIEAAAQGVFGKSAKDLNIAESAFLAGLPQSPFTYTPFTQNKKSNGSEEKETNLKPSDDKDDIPGNDLQAGLNRMKIVLSSMKRNGKITETEYTKALNYEFKYADKGETPTEKYPFLAAEIELRATEILIEQLIKTVGKEEGYEAKDFENNSKLREEYATRAKRLLHQDGLEIHTTINKNIYEAMQQTAKDIKYGPDRPYTEKVNGKKITTYYPIEIGGVLINNNTGAILSMIEGRDFEKSQNNHATRTERQNGSSMKPLLLYGPAIEKGLLQPGMLVADIPTQLGGREFKNYSKNTKGLVTARVALAKSYNVPVVRMFYNLMSEQPEQYLEKMGITLIDNDEKKVGTALGGIKKGVTVEQNVNAYATLANGGNYVESYMIERIVDKNDEEIYKHEPKTTKVFSPQTSYLVTDMLRDVVKYGTAPGLGNSLNFRSDWAAKTGTTSMYKDHWVVAYNPEVTFGTWMGYDKNMNMDSSQSEKNRAAWAKLMNAAYKAAPDLLGANQTFKRPSGIVSRTACQLNGGAITEGCKQAGLVGTDLYSTTFKAGKDQTSFEDTKYVTIGEKSYLALDSTPEEFIQNGLTLTGGYSFNLGLKGRNDEKFPNILGDKVTTLEKTESIIVGGAPSNVRGGKIEGNTLSWLGNPEKDVLGYYVYKITEGSSVKIHTIAKNSSNSLSIDPNGTYGIQAIDIEGKTSNMIEIKGIIEQPPVIPPIIAPPTGETPPPAG